MLISGRGLKSEHYCNLRGAYSIFCISRKNPGHRYPDSKLTILRANLVEGALHRWGGGSSGSWEPGKYEEERRHQGPVPQGSDWGFRTRCSDGIVVQGFGPLPHIPLRIQQKEEPHTGIDEVHMGCLRGFAQISGWGYHMPRQFGRYYRQDWYCRHLELTYGYCFPSSRWS